MALTSKGNFIINGVEYTPKSLKVNYESLADEESGRVDSGRMTINWLYRKIRKVEIEMPPYTNNEASSMATLLAAVQGQEYYITYFDILTNAEKTSYVYTSNSAADCYSGVLINGMWTGLSFNAIELAGE